MSDDAYRRYRPSSAHLLFECPGSPTMQEDIPREDSEEAQEGRLLHEAVYDLDKRKGLTTAQIGLLEVVDEFLGEGLWTHNVALELHDPESFAVGPIMVGTADGVCYEPLDGGFLVGVDWKFGRVPVEGPMLNAQVTIYAGMLLQLTGAPAVRFYILQPRVSWKPQGFTFRNADAIARNVAAAIAEAEKPELILRPGAHCRFCDANAICPAVSRETRQLLASRDNALALTPESARPLWNKIKVVEKRLAGMRAGVTAYVKEQGGTVGTKGNGLRIVEKKGRRQISDIQAAYGLVSGWFTVEEFLRDFCSIKLTDFEDAFVTEALERELAERVLDAKKLFQVAMPITRKDSTEQPETW